MADYLTERTNFICAAGTSVRFSISMSGNVTHKGTKVLTRATKLSGNGICPILTAAAQGTPQPCKFQQTAWLNYDLNCKAEGENLLTASSFCNCPTGSVVKVRFANARGFKQG